MRLEAEWLNCYCAQALLERMPSLRFELLEDQCCVVSAETKTVAHGCTDLHRTGHVRHVVKIALRIREFEVDRWRSDLIVYSKNRSNCLDRACGTEQMSG